MLKDNREIRSHIHTLITRVSISGVHLQEFDKATMTIIMNNNHIILLQFALTFTR